MSNCPVAKAYIFSMKCWQLNALSQASKFVALPHKIQRLLNPKVKINALGFR